MSPREARCAYQADDETRSAIALKGEILEAGAVFISSLQRTRQQDDFQDALAHDGRPRQAKILRWRCLSKDGQTAPIYDMHASCEVRPWGRAHIWNQSDGIRDDEGTVDDIVARER